MAKTKKTTTKKATRKRTKKTTTKKAASKKLTAEEAVEAEAAPSTTTKKTTAKKTPAAKKTTTKKTAKKSTKKTAAKTVKKTAAKKATKKTTAKQTTPKAATTRRKTKAKKEEAPVEVIRHEEADTITFRFPPVAPPPFSDTISETQADVEDALGDAADLREADESNAPDEIGEIDKAAVIEDEPEIGVEMVDAEEDVIIETEGDESDEELVADAIEAEESDEENGDEEEAVAAQEDDDMKGLTRSQKRRLRRRRRKQATDEQETETEEPTSQPTEESVSDEIDLVEEAEEKEASEEGEAVPSRRRRRRSRRRRKNGTAETDADAETTEAESEPAEIVEEQPKEDKSSSKRRRRKPRKGDAPSGPSRKMIINYLPREECRIAILEDGRLEEIFFERASYENHVGSIYKGIVTNVEPSIQAAFIDFGLGKNGFLHITDLHPDYFGAGVSRNNHVENVGRKMPRRSRPPIQKCLKRGQEVIVQITKEGIGTKGPTLSTYLSIPGRFLVMMPGMRRLGISRKIEDEEPRIKLRGLLSKLELPNGMGFIARTAAQGRTVEELQGDLNYLERLWKAVQRRVKSDKAPTELYRESDLVARTIRDVFTNDISEILVDSPEVSQRAKEFLSIFSPNSDNIVKDYDAPEPIFHKFGIEEELEKLHVRRVPLASGGSLVIDSTEALVAIDVNSGRFRTEDDAESTAFKINIEAADEIARQLRLRDLGGVVCCDFIDMRLDKHKREVERRVINNLKKHKERAKVLRMSQFGILEMTRQRQRTSLKRSVYQDCPHCHGTGMVKTLESVVIDLMRVIQFAATREQVHHIEVTLSPDVASLLQNRKRSSLYELEKEHHKMITIRANDSYNLDQINVQCYDQRARPVTHT